MDLARLTLAAVLLVAATAKALDREGTRATLRSFGTPPDLTRPAAWALVAGEAATAAALLVAPLARIGAGLALAMLTLFSAQLWRHRGSVTDCHCFGQLGGGGPGAGAQLRNAGLAALAVVVLAVGAGDVAVWIPIAVAGASVLVGLVAHARRPGAVGRRAPELSVGDRAVLHIFTGQDCGPCAALEADLPNWPLRPDLEFKLRPPSAPRAAYGLGPTPGALVVDRRGRLAARAVYAARDIEALSRWWPEPVTEAGFTARSHGVGLEIVSDDPALTERAHATLPAGAEFVAAPGATRFTLLTRGESAVLYKDWTPAGRERSGEALLETLAAAIRLHVAELAPERAFVHAGVVAWQGRAIVIPGRSFTGKSTLTAALLRTGATYLSDEYAVIDDRGRVHPYPKPIALRDNGGYVSHDHDIIEFTTRPAAEGPVPLGAIVVAPYEDGASWRPVAGTSGSGVMALVDNAVGVRRDPPRILAALRAAVEHATVLEAPRGEADATAVALLEHLDDRPVPR